MATTPDVRVGQIWAANDRRTAGRKLKVVAIEPAHYDNGRPIPTKAVVHNMNAAPDKGFTRIRLDRFQPTSSGYKLVQDVEG